MARQPVSQSVQADVVTKSRRRCALCVFLDNDRSEKDGQIAHLNGKNSDSRLENLVWLCLFHHNRFDSRTSVSKNYTQHEVKRYRDQLYAEYHKTAYSEVEISQCRTYLQKYAGLFSDLFEVGEELAFSVHDSTHGAIEEIANYWQSNSLRSYNLEIRGLQDRISENLGYVLQIYDANSYNWNGGHIVFDLHRIGGDILDAKKSKMKPLVAAIYDDYHSLDKIASL